MTTSPSQGPRPRPSWFQRLLFWIGACTLTCYLAWNAWWLVQGRIPPSILTGLTGIPCPTTGGTRSLMLLLRGDWQESLRANAMTVPILLLSLLTLGWLARQLFTRHRLRLPAGFLWAWGLVLAVAWLLKLLGDPMYW